MQTRARTIVVLALLGAALAAAGTAVAGGHAKHARTVVKLRATSLGKVLVDARGRTLYLYTPDGRNTSTCEGGCASAWPPLLTTGKPRAAKGVQAQLLGVAMRSDGTHQVTYDGHPLYRYSGDSKAGEANGEEVGSVWYAVSAAGAKVERTPGSGTTTTTKSGSGYGY